MAERPPLQEQSPQQLVAERPPLQEQSPLQLVAERSLLLQSVVEWSPLHVVAERPLPSLVAEQLPLLVA